MGNSFRKSFFFSYLISVENRVIINKQRTGEKREGKKNGRGRLLSRLYGKNKAGQFLNSFLRKLVLITLQCNDTTLLSLFAEIKYLELECKENIKAIAS